MLVVHTHTHNVVTFKYQFKVNVSPSQMDKMPLTSFWLARWALTTFTTIVLNKPSSVNWNIAMKWQQVMCFFLLFYIIIYSDFSLALGYCKLQFPVTLKGMKRCREMTKDTSLQKVYLKIISVISKDHSFPFHLVRLAWFQTPEPRHIWVPRCDHWGRDRQLEKQLFCHFLHK